MPISDSLTARPLFNPDPKPRLFDLIQVVFMVLIVGFASAMVLLVQRGMDSDDQIEKERGLLTMCLHLFWVGYTIVSY